MANKHEDVDYEAWLRRRKKKDKLEEFKKWFFHYHNEMLVGDVITGQLYQLRNFLYALIESAEKLHKKQETLSAAIKHDVTLLKKMLDAQQEEVDFANESIDELYYKMDEMA